MALHTGVTNDEITLAPVQKSTQVANLNGPEVLTTTEEPNEVNDENMSSSI